MNERKKERKKTKKKTQTHSPNFPSISFAIISAACVHCGNIFAAAASRAESAVL